MSKKTKTKKPIEVLPTEVLPVNVFTASGNVNDDGSYRGKCPICSGNLTRDETAKKLICSGGVVESHFVIHIKVFEEAWDDYGAKQLDGEQLLAKLLEFNMAPTKPEMNGKWKVEHAGSN